MTKIVTNDDNRKYAIYSRKSKFTGKGDSIGNQIELCKKHLEIQFPNINLDEEVVIYEDEGFTGANTNRPQFQQMVRDIKDDKLKCICCYKLDRISRNVLDFSELQQLIGLHGVSFISITENFDTTSPMGKAMLVITSAFAQLERDTIAERIRDNMLELAKTGRWLGGTPPTGFKSEKIITKGDGKERSLFKLSPIDDEQQIVKLIFKKYMELKSQTKVEKYLIINDIKTKNNKYYNRFSIKKILENPVYAIADGDIYEYFKNLNVQVYATKDEFDGKNGLMVYNKTSQIGRKTHKMNNVEDWIIAIGKHKGIIKGSDWVEIQNMLLKNGDKKYRRPTKNNALLSGILRCSKCGSFMRPKIRNYCNSDGELVFNYLCELKDKSKRQKCNCKNPNGNEVDKLVMEAVNKMVSPNSDLYKSLKKISSGVFNDEQEKQNEILVLKKKYETNEKAIKNYVDKIMYVDGDALIEVNKKICELKDKNKSILEEIKRYDNNVSKNQITDKESAKLVLDLIDNYFSTFNNLDLETKRALLKTIISSVETDGETLIINFIGSNNDSLSDESVPLCDYSKRSFDVFQK